METQISPEAPNQNQFNPRALEVLAMASNEPNSLHFSIQDIGDEQCVVAQVVDLTPDMKEVFEGSAESDDKEVVNDWRNWSRELELLGGAGESEVQAVRSGQTGRQKEIQAAFFNLHNVADLMQAVYELNDLRRTDGITPQEGLPDNIAYLPDNLLIATREIRTNSEEELRALKASHAVARQAGALAVTGKQ